MKYDKFIFKDYAFNEAKKTLVLKYSFDDKAIFQESYKFDFDFSSDYDPQILDQALQTLFFIAGVSYYKAYLPTEIVIEKGVLDQFGADFFGKTYQKGLGEFFYVNGLDPKTLVQFPSNSSNLRPVAISGQEGLLVGLGGGKDSIVSVELLRRLPKVATWSVGHRQQLEPLVQKISLPHFWVEREWDKKLLELKNDSKAYNGHIPISAIFSAVGTVVTVLSGYKDVIVSNENSASDPTLTYKDVDINHQYSKSLEYEKDYQAYLNHQFPEGTRYYSFLRPLSELRVAEVFATIGLDKYTGVFTSCNRAFTHGQNHIFWCGECPKCAFVFLILTPFVGKVKLETLFGGKNLLLDQSLEPTYRQLLGIEGDKPLECVGEIKESRTAMRLAQEKYPELSKYKFEIPADYDYRKLSEHVMPGEIFEVLKTAL